MFAAPTPLAIETGDKWRVKGMSFQIAELLSKSFRLRWLIIVSIALAVLAPQTSLAQQGTLTDDATVTIKKNDNHGTDATLRIEAGSGDASNVFVKFKLTSSLPAGTAGADRNSATSEFRSERAPAESREGVTEKVVCDSAAMNVQCSSE